MDAAVLIQVVTLVSLLAGFIYTWFREARTREWTLADAREVASKLSTDAIAMAAKVNQEAAVMAAKVIADAEKLAAKVHDSAEKLANKVAENTAVSTDAARGAKEAYTEANTINAKIADLNRQLLVVSEFIKQSELDSSARSKASQAEAEFNARVKVAIEEKLREMNGRPPLATRSRRKPR